MAPPPKDYWFHIKYWAYILPLAYVISFLYMVIPLGGMLNEIHDVNIDSCEKISGPADFKYCEDSILSDGVAYVSCDPERTEFNKVMGIDLLPAGQHAKSGDFWRVSYNEVPASIEKLEINKEFDSTSDFHPLGISLDVHPVTNAKILASVNLPHQGESAAIEFFDVDDEHLQLTHKRTVRHPKIYSPNTIHIINDVRLRAEDGTPSFFFSNSFFFTNEHSFVSNILRKLENYFFYLSNVGFYNARTGQVEKGINGLLFANGLSGTDEYLFVSETNTRTVRKYDIVIQTDAKNKPTVTLNFVSQAVFNMAVDNVRYLPEKDLVVVAGHPKAFDFIKYISVVDKSTVTKPPSQVDVWDVSTGEVKTLIQDKGDLFGTSSTGAVDIQNSKLVVAGLYEEGLLICDV